MPHHASAKKRVRQTKTRTVRNRAQNSEMRTAMKSLRLAIADGKKKEALAILPKVQSLLAGLAKKRIIKKNTAGRRLSRPVIQISKL